MHFCLITLFPELFDHFCRCSIVGKAVSSCAIGVEFVDPRQFASPPHHKVDDAPYGGGPGMVMTAPPLVAAIRDCKRRFLDVPDVDPATPKSLRKSGQSRTIFLSPSGTLLTQRKVEELASYQSLILLCGRYEGVDQRVIDLEVDEELSIGDYIVMGGEVGAMVLIEAVTRLLPGVLGNPSSVLNESHDNSFLLEAPHYTRPATFEGLSIPPVLLTGHHQEIETWRHQERMKRTKERRPDLWERSSSSMQNSGTSAMKER